MINGSTKIVGLIGHPVEHSFSPPMHNAAFNSIAQAPSSVKRFPENPNVKERTISAFFSVHFYRSAIYLNVYIWLLPL